jgi:hypothetical protein
MMGLVLNQLVLDHIIAHFSQDQLIIHMQNNSSQDQLYILCIIIFEHYYQHFQEISRIYDPFSKKNPKEPPICNLFKKNPKEPPICNLFKKNPKTLYLMKLILKFLAKPPYAAF